MLAAENLWKEVLESQVFEGVDRETIYTKARETRAICVDERVREKILERAWKYLRPMLWKQATAITYVRNHLAMCEDQKEWILNEMKQRILEETMKTGSIDSRNILWNRMLVLA
jgi:hypothetical protein